MDFNIASIKNLILLLCFTSVKNYTRSLDDNTVADLDSGQLIKKFGYDYERHLVQTEDGYLVSLFRLPKKGPPVLLVHGIGDSSDSWVILGPNKSLSFQLVESGFDVWMFNARGNKYSKGHTAGLGDNDEAYWNFSFQEMGTQDLPATIDHILSKTSYSKLSYVGFSQGTTIFLVMASTRPEYNEKIKKAVLLAPVAWVNHLTHPLISMLSPNIYIVAPLFHKVGLHALFANDPAKNKLHAAICREGALQKLFCDIEFYLNYGIRQTKNLENYPAVASHIPAGTSTNTFAHFIQEHKSKRFQRFSYGWKKNLFVYGSLEPPEFDVSRITVPLTIFSSGADWFSNPGDVQILRSRLPNIVKYVEFNKSLDFTHIEFVYGTRVVSLVNKPVLNILLGDT